MRNIRRTPAAIITSILLTMPGKHNFEVSRVSESPGVIGEKKPMRAITKLVNNIATNLEPGLSENIYQNGFVERRRWAPTHDRQTIANCIRHSLPVHQQYQPYDTVPQTSVPVSRRQPYLPIHQMFEADIKLARPISQSTDCVMMDQSRTESKHCGTHFKVSTTV